MPPSSAPERGAATPLRDWLAPWLELLQVRLRLLALEVEEGTQRLGELLAWGMLAALCLGLGVVCAAVLLAVLFWEEHRIAVLLGLCTLFFGVGALAVWWVVRQLRAGLQLFSATLAELQRDLDRLRL